MLGPCWSLFVVVVALFAPIDLPAGGVDRRPAMHRVRKLSRGHLLTTHSTSISVSPDSQAPSLDPLDAGEPLYILRYWLSPSQRTWAQVEYKTQRSLLLVKRGWIPLC